MMEDKCPNGCIDGYYVDPYTHKKVICQHCLEKRRKEANTADIQEKLNLPPSLCGSNYAPEAIIPPNARKHLEEESVKAVLAKCQEVLQNLSIGELPTESMLFNFGAKCKDNNFVAPLMRKAYASGLSLTRVLTPIDIMKSRRCYSQGIKDEDAVDYEEILSKQVCVIIIDAGTMYEELLAIKGVMQLRGLRNLPTILVTHLWNKSVAQLFSEDNESLYNLATLYSIQYNKTAEQGIESSGRLTLDEFKEHKNFGV